MTEAEARAVLDALARRAEEESRLDFERLSFGPQRAFIEDDSRLIAAVCGRRAGKTDGMALKAIRTATNIPHSHVLYITLSRPAAKRIMWPKLLFWDRTLKLGAKFNAVELSMTLKNGSVIMLGGANDETEIERYRGDAYALVILDEAQAFRAFIEKLILEILAPATLDYGGTIAMIGTPNPGAFGYFHDATTGKIVDEDGKVVWKTHHWTAFDNPNIDELFKDGKHHDVQRALARAHEKIMETMRLDGLPLDDPKHRREWWGEWVRDEEGLVFPIPKRALIPFLPLDVEWSYVLGVDVGYVDATAFVVLAYNPESMRIVVVDSYQRTEMIPSAVAAEVDRLNERWAFDSIVVDPGGGGKAYVEEMRQKFGLPAQVAQKTAKLANIELLNGDLRAGVLTIVEPHNEELLHDASLLQWDYSKVDKFSFRQGSANRSGDQRGYIPKAGLRIDDRTPDHLLDAMLYGYRECKAMYDPEEQPPIYGTPAYTAQEEQALLDRARQRAANTHSPDQEWWERGY